MKHIEEIPDSLKEWFKKLWSGTTSKGRQQLFAYNNDYSLIRIFHSGVARTWGAGISPGFTEWVVAINGKYKHGGHYMPETVWEKNGKLLKEEKKMIAEKYSLIIKYIL